MSKIVTLDLSPRINRNPCKRRDFFDKNDDEITSCQLTM